MAEDFTLDFSLGSLVTVDSLLEEAKQDEEQEKDMLSIKLGSYVGEVLVRQVGGRWYSKEESEDYPALHVVFDGLAGLTVAPIARCRNRIRNGEARSIAALAGVLAAMQDNPTALA